MAKVIFIQDVIYEHIGTMSLSAILKKNNHEVDILIPNLEGGEDEAIKKLKKLKPDLVAFSVITGGHKWSLSMALRVKKSLKKPIIFGGPHATYFPEIIKYQQVDYVCIGEGEYSLLELCNRIDSGAMKDDIPNIWAKKGRKIIRNEVRNLIDNLDELPFPDRELYYKYPKLKRSRQKRFMTTRGCPYDCSFCFNHVFRTIYCGKGKAIRRRSIKNVIEEVLQVKDNYGMHTAYFEDDTFILDRKWIVDFLKEYKKKIDRPFICLIRANLVNDEIIKSFKDARCKRVFMGVETGDEVLRNKLLKKRLTNADIIKAAKLLHKYKIKFKTYNMLGLPDETIENALKTLELNAQIKTNYPWCSIFQPYPGTELGQYAIEKGYMSKNFDSDDILPYFSNSVMNQKIDIQQIINLQRFFVIGIKLPFTIPLIKKLIKLPPNFIFDIVFLIGYAYTYLGSEDISIMDNFIDGIRYIKRLFYNKI
jgi:radical SAM superfamily enzyme YgiQ (UPF0313 family)